jgi:DNA-directed RNA polymerase subunit RPC12/RpoP
MFLFPDMNNDLKTETTIESKICSKCGEDLPLTEFSKSSGANYLRRECKKCNNQLAKERKAIKEKYETPDESYVCPVCLSDHESIKYAGGQKCAAWTADHIHGTEILRGFICHNCNRGFGMFKHNVEILQRAIEYLEKSDDL